jgi:hypothetical protein
MLRKCLALVLSLSTFALAQGNSWNRVRYNGGTISTKVDPKDWGNKLSVTPDLITFQLKDGQKIEITPRLISSLSYGQEAHRRVGTMIALGILVSPVALFGLFHKTRLHFIGVQYSTQEGKKGGLLMQGDKDNYRAILVALQSVSRAPVSVAEKEREFVPVGLTTTVAAESEGPAQSSPKAATQDAATIPAASYSDAPNRTTELNGPASSGAKGGVLGVAGNTWDQGGVQITSITPESAANIAGLQVGEVIRSVDGQTIRTTKDLADALARHAPGSRVKVAYLFKTGLGWIPKEVTLILGGAS